MIGTRSTLPGLILAACAVLLEGCVERKEHLTITAGGSVLYDVAYASDSQDDLYGGDAVPRPAAGWNAQEVVKKDDEGKESFELKAEAVFPAGSALPANYALVTEADGDLYLQFPTTLQIEERGDGVYYHFARTYSPRPWAAIQTLQERLVQLPMAELKDIDPAQWTPAQLDMVARALSSFETEKLLHFARAAFRQATPEVSQDGWLAVQHHLRDCLNHLDYRKIARLITQQQAAPDDELREKSVTAELETFADLLNDQLKQSLFTLAGYNGAQYSRFMTEYDRCTKAHEITEDLGDDRFEIVVEMPGQIIASNAESTWKFDGQMVRDRELELLATSRVPK